VGVAGEYWWELDDAAKVYRPCTQNLKNFKPASGLLHHFFATYVDNVQVTSRQPLVLRTR
jgi:hypothetical protein